MLRVVPLLLLLVACGSAPVGPLARSDGEREGLQELSWLLGPWTTVGEGARHQERWVELTPSRWMGFARRSENGETTHHELIHLARDGDAITYTASPAGQPSVEFRLASVVENETRFIHPTHDPGWVHYRRTGEQLVAGIGISGDEEPYARWEFARGSTVPALVQAPVRLCREGSALTVTVQGCYCAAEVFCAGFSDGPTSDVLLAVVDRTCDACTEATGECAVPAPPSTLNATPVSSANAEGCIEGTFPLLISLD
ncbi:MAG: DUF6265 family protein [Myxococcota bacterium]